MTSLNRSNMLSDSNPIFSSSVLAPSIVGLIRPSSVTAQSTWKYVPTAAIEETFVKVHTRNKRELSMHKLASGSYD